MQIVPFDALACPLCGMALAPSVKSALCGRGHCFDYDRKGALNLLPVQLKKSREPGDSKDMVCARAELLDSGLYQPVADKLHTIMAQFISQRPRDRLHIFDAGCGEGYYTIGLLNHLADLDAGGNIAVMGMDISKDAIRAASKRSKDITWIVSTNARIPVPDKSIDVILSLFGFPVWAEFRRALKPNGMVVSAGPGPDHLIELRRVLYPRITQKSMEVGTIPDGFIGKHHARATHSIHAPQQDDIARILAMTPHGYRATPERKQAALEMRFPVLTLDVFFRIYALEMTA